MHGSLPSPQPCCQQSPIPRDRRGLAGSQMLLPTAGEAFPALLELLWDQHVQFPFLHHLNSQFRAHCCPKIIFFMSLWDIFL